MAGSGSFVGTVRRFFRDYVTAMSARGSFGKLMSQAVGDTVLRERLIKSPMQVLAEAGIKLPLGVTVEVLENIDKIIHLVLPPLVETGESKGGKPLNRGKP